MYWGLACSSIGLFICLFFRFTITAIETLNVLDSKLLDFKLVSIEDYSVTGRISRDFYDYII
jgi:hypothetical protein